MLVLLNSAPSLGSGVTLFLRTTQYVSVIFITFSMDFTSCFGFTIKQLLSRCNVLYSLRGIAIRISQFSSEHSHLKCSSRSSLLIRSSLPSARCCASSASKSVPTCSFTRRNSISFSICLRSSLGSLILVF